MTLAPHEFIRRFLLHVLPAGLHRIRHYGLFANTTRRDNLARAREVLMRDNTETPADAQTHGADSSDSDDSTTYVCPDCGAAMRIIETFLGRQLARGPPRCSDSS